ncbi:CP family cyanate transporter-like MFS transporter [Rhizobium mesoamericanum]|uniref:MFS transporter n=1 Tax=Rhizobium mesoamericanum TaxID=1079800 RepID=UPI0027893386|nr:MFS transporter [Rhizobium mesoamericanum]MDQ0563198.1 CP family cyanate transporter-like MFS transporter [Rhizobium mesoamericanum]
MDALRAVPLDSVKPQPSTDASPRPAAADELEISASLKEDDRRSAGLSEVAALACVVLVAIDLRPAIVSVGPLLPSIRNEFAISNAQASLLTAIPAVLMGLLAFPTPWLARRFGRDKVMLVALATLTIATFARAFAESVISLFATTAAVGAGIAVAGALVAGFIKNNYPRHVALFMGVYACAIGLGSTISAAVTGPLAEAVGGWRIGAGGFAIPGLIAIAAWQVIARAERHKESVRSDKPVPDKGSVLPFTSPIAWLAALYFSLNNFLFFGLIAWIAPMYIERGMSSADAALLLASFTAAFMTANPLAGFISRRNDRRGVIALFASTSLLGILAIALLPAMPYFFIPMIAFGVGGSFTLGMVLPLDHAGDSNEANAWTAFVLGIGYFAGALGPFVLGLARDSTGGFTIAVWMLVVAAFLKLSLATLLRPRRG